MIICCSPIREAVKVQHIITQGVGKTLIHGKECYIVIVIYLPFQHKCIRYNHRIMFHTLLPRACRTVIPFHTGNDVIAGLKWYYGPASLKRTVNCVYCITLYIHVRFIIMLVNIIANLFSIFIIFPFRLEINTLI